MTKEEVLKKVVDILKKYSKSELAPEQITMETTILDDLKVNSARLVDIVLDFEDAFDIQVDDADADKVRTVGDGVELILSKVG
ncbi:MAG: acyl carrier protein [Candidatus Omnitrophica bacterium]|nr:acyl carrier protein [Candidatus Omnitrophota bacterium]